jgi:trimeric autotransporter adhesin
MQGGADLQGFGNTLANSIFGNSGNNLINGGAGADTMVGGLGNDTYFVDDGLEQVIENVGAGNDAIFTTAHFVLSANVETLVQQGSADLGGTGNALANSIFGNSGNNTLDGQGGAYILTGNPGNDSCSMSARPPATPSWTSPAMARGRAIRCASSATGRVRPSPTSTRRTGRSTTTAAPRTT